MINNIIISRKTREILHKDNYNIGLEGENLQETLVFNLDEELEGQGIIEIKFPDESTGFIEIEKTELGYELPLKSSLLKQSGQIEMQLTIMQNKQEVFKSEPTKFRIKKSINATETIPEQYPTWIENLETLKLNLEKSEEERVTSEKSRVEAEDQREETFSQMEESIEEAVKEIADKKADYDKNAIEKTNEYNKLAEQKTKEFDDNSTEQTEKFDKNVESQTKTFNDNSDKKVSDFNKIVEDKILELQSDGNIMVRQLNPNVYGNKFTYTNTSKPVFYFKASMPIILANISKLRLSFEYINNRDISANNYYFTVRLLTGPTSGTYLDLFYSIGSDEIFDLKKDTSASTNKTAFRYFYIYYNDKNGMENYDFTIKNIKLYLDDEIIPLELTPDVNTSVTEIQPHNDYLVGQDALYKHINEKLNKYTPAEKSFILTQFNKSIIGKTFHIVKEGSYPGMTLYLLRKYDVDTIQVKFKAKRNAPGVNARISISTFNVANNNKPNSSDGHYVFWNYSYNSNFNYTDLKETIKPFDISISLSSTKKEVNAIGIGINTNVIGNFDFTLYDIELYINNELVEDWYFDKTEASNNKENAKYVEDETDSLDVTYLATKDYVDKAIKEANAPSMKEVFNLPFVNNLYVVQGTKRKNSVPVFIDYLYNGNSNKILFDNGEDRKYIRENESSTQSKDIINAKETFSFKSDTLNVPDITFNKLSIKESVPNGDIKLLIIGDSVTAGAITNETYWSVARRLFALEDIDQNRTSHIMFLGSNLNKTVSGSYNNKDYSVQACACGISSTSLEWWMTNENSHFVYTDSDGNKQFSILKWIERYRNYDDNGNKLVLDNENIGTNITSSNINNVMCCTPNIIYINHTHNGGTIAQYEECIEKIREELPDCKIIIGAGMPLIGTWHKDKYIGKDWLDSGNITGPNYDWASSNGTGRVESMKNWCLVERGEASLNGNTYNDIYYMPQIVLTPTVEALEPVIVDCGVKQMKQVSKLNQLPREHPGTIAHQIWGYELYALLKFIQNVNNGQITNNFDDIPLYQ